MSFEVIPDDNWKEVERWLQQFPQIAEPQLKEAMENSVHTIERAVKPNVPVGVSGALRSSIGSTVYGEGTDIVGRVGSSISEAYPIVMEAGAKPHFPPPGNLLLWVRRKRIVGTYSIKSRRRMGSRSSQDEEDMAAAFLIARAISRRGIKGRFFMKEAWENSQAAVEKYFSAALKRIVAAVHGSGR